MRFELNLLGYFCSIFFQIFHIYCPRKMRLLNVSAFLCVGPPWQAAGKTRLLTKPPDKTKLVAQQTHKQTDRQTYGQTYGQQLQQELTTRFKQQQQMNICYAVLAQEMNCNALELAEYVIAATFVSLRYTYFRPAAPSCHNNKRKNSLQLIHNAKRKNNSRNRFMRTPHKYLHYTII